MIKDDLHKKHIYLDSDVLIYLIAGFESQPLNDLKEMISNNEIEISFNEYSYTEVLRHSAHKYKNKETRKNIFYKISEFLEMFNIIDLSVEIAEKAATFGGRNELDSLSAIHVMSAVVNKCEVFLTNDKDINIVPDGLKLIHFSDYDLNLKQKITV